MRSTDYYIPAIVLGVALALKLPALVRRPRDPLLWSLCLLIFLDAMVFTFAAPPTIQAVNAASGVPNLAAPLTYSIVTALSASCWVLLICWHSGDPHTVRRVTRWCALGFAAVSVALFVLFFLGEAPVERLRDFDTYYATTPFVREMILLYLVAYGASCVGVSVLCWRWSRRVRSWVKGGMALLICAFTIVLGNAVCKLVAVGARWTGTDWDVLSTSVGPLLAAVGAPLCTAGFLLPMVGPRCARAWTDGRAYRRLGPMLRELNSPPQVRPHQVSLAPWASMTLRVMRRKTAIHDGLLRLGPYLDDRIRTEASAAARCAGQSEQAAAIVGSAAMIAAAVQTERRGLRDGTAMAAHRGPDAFPGACPDAGPDARPDAFSGALTYSRTAKTADLQRISQALHSSAIVARFRREAAAEGERERV
ncbi:MAB_1171c family putative transporter [Streptomyces sp. NPDC002851]